METKLPKCYIFDIDNCIAHRVSRSPFDWHSVSEDIPDESMKQIYQTLFDPKNSVFENTLGEGVYFIFITGRDEVCRTDTIDWLSRNNFFYHKLYMRPKDNKQLDTQVKLKIYKEEIEGKYEVIAVFEDSKRCVELYRDHLKLKVLQVASSER